MPEEPSAKRTCKRCLVGDVVKGRPPSTIGIGVGGLVLESCRKCSTWSQFGRPTWK